MNIFTLDDEAVINRINPLYAGDYRFESNVRYRCPFRVDQKVPAMESIIAASSSTTSIRQSIFTTYHTNVIPWKMIGNWFFYLTPQGYGTKYSLSARDDRLTAGENVGWGMSDRERAKTGEYVETVTPDRVLDAVAGHPDPTVTAREVGEAIGCSTDAARKKLNQLHESGDVKRKKVGGRSIVWWLDESAFARELSRKSIANQHGDDHFAENPGWADDLPDLGENA
jgi:hypothetical protein